MSSWTDLDARPNRPSWRQLVAGAALSIATAAVVLEVTVSSVSRWTADHPATVTLGAGALLVILTALAVERLLARLEERRRRQPALRAIDTYVFSGDRAATRIHQRLHEQLRALPRPPRQEPRVVDALEMLLEQDRPQLVALSEFVRHQADDLGLVAMSVTGMVARYEPFADVVGRVFELQRQLSEAAEGCNALSFLGQGDAGERPKRVRELIGEQAQRVDSALQDFVSELQTMRLQVLEAQQGPRFENDPGESG